MPVDGGHLWADDSGGAGPALALLHPGWGDSSIWLPMVDGLVPSYRVIRYDTRGQLRVPAAMVIGDRDYPSMIGWARDIAARIPGCAQIAAPGAGHLLPLRLPSQLAELVGKLDRSEDLPAEIGSPAAP